MTTPISESSSIFRSTSAARNQLKLPASGRTAPYPDSLTLQISSVSP